MESYKNVPNAIFYLLKGDYKYLAAARNEMNISLGSLYCRESHVGMYLHTGDPIIAMLA